MATRRDIIDVVYDKLVDYGGRSFTVTYDDGSTENLTLTSDDIDLVHPEYLEKRPFVAFQNQATRHVSHNGVGAGPDWVERDSNGNVVYTEWREYAEVFFTITIRMDKPAQLDPVYEAIRRGFGKYAQGEWSPSELHEDIRDIRVEAAAPANSTEQEDAIWGDQLELYVEFTRNFIIESGGTVTMDEAVEAVENIAQVNLDLDVDNDGTVDYQYTIT